MLIQNETPQGLPESFRLEVRDGASSPSAAVGAGRHEVITPARRPNRPLASADPRLACSPDPGLRATVRIALALDRDRNRRDRSAPCAPSHAGSSGRVRTRGRGRARRRPGRRSPSRRPRRRRRPSLRSDGGGGHAVDLGAPRREVAQHDEHADRGGRGREEHTSVHARHERAVDLRHQLRLDRDRNVLVAGDDERGRQVLAGLAEQLRARPGGARR